MWCDSGSGKQIIFGTKVTAWCAPSVNSILQLAVDIDDAVIVDAGVMLTQM